MSKLASRRQDGHVVLLQSRSVCNEPCSCLCAQPVTSSAPARRPARIPLQATRPMAGGFVSTRTAKCGTRSRRSTSSAPEQSRLQLEDQFDQSGCFSEASERRRRRLSWAFHAHTETHRYATTRSCYWRAREASISLRHCHAGRTLHPLVLLCRAICWDIADLLNRSGIRAPLVHDFRSGQHAHPTSCGQSGISRARRCTLDYISRSDRIRPKS